MARTRKAPAKSSTAKKAHARRAPKPAAKPTTSRRKPAAKKPAAKRGTSRKPPTAAKEQLDLGKLGARVLSIFGPFDSRVMIELPATAAADLFPKTTLAAAGRAQTLDAVERDLAELRERAPDLADSALAATALQLAYELDAPHNSATSKSMCARVLVDTIARLRDLAPPEANKDGVDDINADRVARRARVAAAADKSSP